MSVWCSIGLLAALLPGCEPADALRLAGYVEGEYTNLAPVEVSRVEAVFARRGERVSPGMILAKMEDQDASLAMREAEANLHKLEAQLADLKLGKRAEEIAVIGATLASAKADAHQAELALARRKELFQKGVTSKADFDQAQANFDVASARIAEIEANLTVARLPARADTIKAMEQQVNEAMSALNIAHWKLDERRIVARNKGRVFDVLKRQGETAGPTAPVIAFLPDGAIKLRFYAPEKLRGRLEPGARVSVFCDGCPASLTATVSFVADEPEFTPPVIYSLETRQKLVYLVEARPQGDVPSLQPGQIIDVRLADPP